MLGVFILGCPIPRAELLKSFQKDKPGATQIGFTFDGDDFAGQGDAAGASFEIVAKELHYLEASIWTWHRRDGLLTLGCGRGADGIERILAIRDGQLWAIWRNGVQQPDGSWKSTGTWAARPIPVRTRLPRAKRSPPSTPRPSISGQRPRVAQSTDQRRAGQVAARPCARRHEAQRD